MFYIVLFILTVAVMVIIVRIGAMALKLTGMEWDNAWFQALSAFTTTGFTTARAEQVIKNSRRRNVIAWLMILGNAGFITVVITLLKTTDIKFDINFLYQALYLIGIIFLLYILFLILSRRVDVQKIIGKLDKLIEKYLLNTGTAQKEKWEEIFHTKEGYGFARVEIQPENPYCGQALTTTGLSSHQIIVVTIERESEFIPTPGGDETIESGDRLVCYGKLNSIKEKLVGRENPEHQSDKKEEDIK